MSVDRIVRVNELLRREIGEALYRLLHEADVDLSTVTVTHVITSRNLRHAKVLVSIRDHEGERPRMLGLLRKHRAEIQDRINRDIKLKFTPCLNFELDTSVEQGDRVLGLLSKLESEEDHGAAEPSDNAPVPSGGDAGDEAP